MALKMAMRGGAKGPKQSIRQLPMGVKPTAQNKIINVADKLGIPGLQNQQGTTRTIYHAIQMPEGAADAMTYNFFKNVKQVSAPFTNISDNKLQAGEAIAVERMYFAVLTITTATGAVVDLETLDSFALPAMYMGQFNLKIGSQDYTKDVSMACFKPEFNKSAMHANYNVYEPGVFTVIPPDLQFYVPVDAPETVYPSSDTLSFYLVCFIEGDGSILNMKNTL